MKKVLLVIALLISYVTTFAQTPQIGHFQTLTTVRRGDTLDVTWFYRPGAADVRTFQVDWQYKKTLLTHISTTVDASVNGMTPAVSYKTWDNYKYGSYSNGTYNYTSNSEWTIGRNYLVLSSGSTIGSSGYIIHNKYKINSVSPNYVSDTITVNWARMFDVNGTTIGDNVAQLTNQKLAIKLLGNLTLSGKVWLGPSMTLRPTVWCYKASNNAFIDSVTVNADGSYVLDNVDENTKYKLDVRFPAPLTAIRDNAVTIADAVKTYDEYTVTDVNQTFSRTYLKNGLAYLIADINKTGTLDGGDAYSIYASVSGLKPIDTAKLINVFTKSVYDSLAIGTNQWNDWASYINGVTYVFDSVGTGNLTGVDIKYFILGDVDRTHSSPVYDAGGALVAAAKYIGTLDVNIPNVTAPTGQAMYANFNMNTNGIKNDGLQFEMKYDPAKVKFEEIISNIQGPWLQYLTHDETNGIIRFGGMNNQILGSLTGNVTPFKLKFSPIGNNDIQTNVYVRRLMDASDRNGDHFNINLASDYIVLSSRANPGYVLPSPEKEITAMIRPNPTSGFFELVVMFPRSNMNSLARVYDTQGRLIKEIGKVSSTEYYTTVVKQVDLTAAINGNYLLVLDNGNQKRLTKQFIKI
jgi:hypothetical protein